MEDRFKFKAWDKRLEKFIDDWSLAFHSGCVFQTFEADKLIRYENDDLILMQCTGLKDKNGKLIFEGDILKDFEGDVGTVYYKLGEGFRYGDFFGLNSAVEIIGNIYEHSHLLKPSDL